MNILGLGACHPYNPTCGSGCGPLGVSQLGDPPLSKPPNGSPLGYVYKLSFLGYWIGTPLP
jgi:hypothetical protein